MFDVKKEDNSIYVTRGDVFLLDVSAVSDDGAPYIFQLGDKLRFTVCKKKDVSSVMLQQDTIVTEDTLVTEEHDTVQIYIKGEDNKFGGLINKPTDYWYQIELNPDTAPLTIIGYDEDGTKVFRHYPETAEKEVE
jgi:hypothetical protein